MISDSAASKLRAKIRAMSPEELQSEDGQLDQRRFEESLSSSKDATPAALHVSLADDVGRRFGAPVEMMQLKHGIFDEGTVSVIAPETMNEVSRLAGVSPDVRRFRPNIVVRLLRPAPFQEDEWVGGVLSFGDGDDAAAISVTLRDARCSMLNFDPDSAESSPEVLKAAVRANENNAGVYGAVTRAGRLEVGQTIRFRRVT